MLLKLKTKAALCRKELEQPMLQHQPSRGAIWGSHSQIGFMWCSHTFTQIFWWLLGLAKNAEPCNPCVVVWQWTLSLAMDYVYHLSKATPTVMNKSYSECIQRWSTDAFPSTVALWPQMSGREIMQTDAEELNGSSGKASTRWTQCPNMLNQVSSYLHCT